MNFHEIFMWSGQMLDAALSALALSNNAQEFREANPLLPESAFGILSIKVSATLAIHLLLRHWRERHPKLTRTLSYIIGSLGFGAATINLYRMNK